MSRPSLLAPAPAPVHSAARLAGWAALHPLRTAAGPVAAFVPAVLGAAAAAAAAADAADLVAAIASAGAAAVLAPLVRVGTHLARGAHASALGAGAAAAALACAAVLTSALVIPVVPLIAGLAAAAVLRRVVAIPAQAVKAGEIWWAAVRFSDRDEYKIRPVVVTAVHAAGRWVSVIPLTSQPGKGRRAGRLEVTGPWSGGRRSYARTDDPRVLTSGELRNPAGMLDRRLLRALRRA